MFWHNGLCRGYAGLCRGYACNKIIRVLRRAGTWPSQATCGPIRDTDAPWQPLLGAVPPCAKRAQRHMPACCTPECRRAMPGCHGDSPASCRIALRRGTSFRFSVCQQKTAVVFPWECFSLRRSKWPSSRCALSPWLDQTQTSLRSGSESAVT